MLKINTSKLINILFYISFFLLNIIWFMSNITFIHHYDYIKLVAIVLLLIICIMQSKSYSKVQLLTIIAFITFGLLSYYKSKDERILVFILLLLSTKRIDMEKLIKIDVFIKIFMLCTMPIFLKMGYIKNYFEFFREGMQRYTWGFSHPNIFAFVFVSMIIEIFYLKKNNRKLIFFIIYILLMLLITRLTDSRASLVLSILCAIPLFISESTKKRLFDNIIIKSIIKNSWLVLSLLFIFFGILYFNKIGIAIKLDSIFTTRIHFISYFIDHYGVNLFGHEIFLSTTMSNLERAGTAQIILDNTYVFYLISYGLCSFMIITVFMRKFFDVAIYKKEYTLALIIFAFVIYLSMENRLHSFPLILFLGKYFYENNKIRRNENENFNGSVR